MAARINESRNSPLVSPNAGLTLASGVQTVTPCQKLVLYMSAGPGNVTIRTMDGNSVAINALATATLFILDVQFDMVTWTGTATAVAFYTQ